LPDDFVTALSVTAPARFRTNLTTTVPCAPCADDG